ncbi:cation-transporting P-type ATPase [Rugamonas sp. DEMB1]|uniref:cation-transporting P-type ATPase n=1 Tax=Rugamonas sp. DEMB1 TaxID=3039386 RepID=UPI003919F980
MAQAAPSGPAAHAWHAMDAQAVLDVVATSRTQGVSDAEAQRRRAEFGGNTLPSPKRRGPARRLLLQFHNVLIYVLLGAAAITAALGHLVDSGVIAGVVVINALIGFVQEGKAERALDALRQMLSFNAQVLREGRRREIPAHELVRGDIVFLSSGDKVPADLRLLEIHSLRIEEAALTGESVAVDKGGQSAPADAALGDRACMAYSSTLVTYGQGVGVVVATGAGTEIGRISAMLADVQELATPLLRQLAAFGRWLTWATLLLAGLAFAFGTWVRAYSAADMFLVAVGLAVALIPEGLPAIMTITLAIGVQRMARRNAIIRRLPAVEALGSVTIICTDKTGTLTRNEMTVRRVVTADAMFDVSGAGYGPHGGFAVAGGEVDPAAYPALREIGVAALLCNDAALCQAGGEWQLAGDPTEGALVALAMKVGLDQAFEREALPRVDVIPFESEHRFMATLHHDHGGRRRIFIKGAPEIILALCQWQREDGRDGALAAAYWRDKTEDAAARGMRLLAVATRPAAQDMDVLGFADVDLGQFTLLAVLGLSDPPREEAIAAVARCRSAGIRVKMVTGDHAATARAIGEQLGLAAQIKTLCGAEMEAMDDTRLAAAVMDTDVFARASPEHKLRLVRALQSHGEVVAMTGDGVNDAPALKRADVGIAMGRKGTEVAKEAAEMVLADDNFASIAAAVEEGRGVYDNIRKAIAFILPTNGGEAGMLLTAILFGLTMPITPVQILWVNMITAVTLSLAIAFESREADTMGRPPRDPREPLLTGFLVWRIAFVTFLIVAGGMGLFLWETDQGASLETARTATVNALVMGEIVYLFNVRRFTAPALTRQGIFGNPYALWAVATLLLFQALFTYLPAMQRLFGTADIGAAAWARIVLFGVAVLLVVELEKWLLFRSKFFAGTKRATPSA